MKNYILALSALFLLSSCGSNGLFKKKADVTDYAASITQDDLREHLTIYASDEFAGRDTGTEGETKAINYLRDQYKAMGVTSPMSDYFQNVPLFKSGAAQSTVSVGDDTFTLGEDYINYFSAPDGTTAWDDIVYLGYGIKEDDYNDYADVEMEGKVVIMQLGEPMNDDGTYMLSGTEEPSMWSNLRSSYSKRSELAKANGASSMLIALDEAGFGGFMSQYKRMTEHGGRLSLDAETDDEGYSFFVSPAMLTAIVGESDGTAKAIEKSTSISYKNDVHQINGQNVLAHVKGKDKPEEYIVITAHLDHVGVDGDGNIYNGADDDGSGTVAILEIAEAFQRAAEEGNGPSRSILFLHVTAEEKGLLGSQYYTDKDPIIPLANTVANLNIDMIGRIDPKRTEGERNYIYLIGSDRLSTELHDISEAVNEEYMQIELDYTFNAPDDPNNFYGRSDHYNFAKNNIPIIFYFNGTHDDYHQPSDTIEKINFDLLENRSRLIFHTAWELANRAERVVVDKPVDLEN